MSWSPRSDAAPKCSSTKVLFALLVTILLPVPHVVSNALGLHCPYV